MKRRDLATATLTCLLAASAWGQQTPQQKFVRHEALQLPLVPIERFSGPLPARRNAALAGGRVVFRHWNIANDQIVEIPHEGFLLVHLHHGEIMVTAGAERAQKHGDEFFTVPPGVRLIVETGSDSVVLRTLDTITR